MVSPRQLRQRGAGQGVGRQRAQCAEARHADGRRGHLRADRRADRAPHPLLREARAIALARGQRYGFIRFGSRVDLYLPPDAIPRASVGDKVYATDDDRRRTALTPGAAAPTSAAVVATASVRDGRLPDRAALLKNRVRRRGIYLLPNLFTTAALFAGFYAIVQAMNDNFDQAAVAIFVAMVLDGLDGRVARMTRTQSAFGAEYDSLADMVSFGAAPALVIYEWVLRDMGKLGWIAAFVYVAGAALRLARFNTLLEVADKRWFQGLPSPSAAALVAGLRVDRRRSGLRPGRIPRGSRGSSRCSPG